MAVHRRARRRRRRAASSGGGGATRDLLGEAPAPPDGIDAGTAADLERARIEAAWPAMGAEIVPGETIPAETGVASVAVDFRKGCYPGQELVERMDSRGADGAPLAPRRHRRPRAPRPAIRS